MRWAALQQAIYDKLTGNSALVAMLSSAYAEPAVFSRVPQAADSEDAAGFPYITMFEASGGPFDDKETVGGETLVQISVWSRGTTLAARVIMDAVDATIRRQPLTMTDANHITTELDTSNVGYDPDGTTVRATLQYRVMWQVEV